MEVDGPGNHVNLNLGTPANWDGTFGAQACIRDISLTNCDPWQTFHIELPLAADDRNFCVRYAGHATSAATVGLQRECGFETATGRWSTDNALHLNWCVGMFRNAGFDAGQLAAARNLAKSEEALRTEGLTTVCPPPCPEGQMRLQGQCQVPPILSGSTLGTGGGFIQMFPECGPGRKYVQSENACVADAPPPTGPVDAVPAPAPGDGGPLTASTCGLSGTATVVIADPALTTLNVRDKPNGNILPTKIPENAQVEVMGPCGMQLSAGIVAQKPDQVIPGWCAISTPQVTGCVSEQFLVAGIPPAGPVGAGSAGIVANQPQTVVAPTFTGTWSAEAQGSGYTFVLNQDGNTVTGNYSGGDGSNGQLNGSVSGNVLRFAWQQTDGVSGAGKFALSGDGNSFDGSYTLGTDPDVAEGSWNGTRQ
jgi:hypothetical protein